MNTHRLPILTRRVLTALVVLALVGCSSVSHSNIANSNQPNNSNQLNNENSNTSMTDRNDKPTSDTAVDSRLVSANTKFGLKLFAEVSKQGGGKNLFISPASVGLALAMTYVGAVGETKAAMERVLETRGMTHPELNQAYAQLRAALESADPKVQLNIANSLWAAKGISFNPDFIQRNRQFYGAELTTLDFGDPGAPASINSWVSDKTKGKIPNIVDNIDPQAILFLINAIYFNGKWSAAFDKAKTNDDVFTTAPGQQKRHPMMHQSGKYRYYESKDFQAVSLPYGAGRVSMYVFLPTKGISLTEFQKTFSAANWEAWMNGFMETKGEIALPRFKVEYEIGLNDVLKTLGMGIAFDTARADFSGIGQSSGKIFISRVKHKTFAEVNEEGTEAAAATSVEMSVTSMRQEPPKTFRMIVDHPFVCAIRDNQTGTLLFIGSIADPM